MERFSVIDSGHLMLVLEQIWRDSLPVFKTQRHKPLLPLLLRKEEAVEEEGVAEVVLPFPEPIS